MKWKWIELHSRPGFWGSIAGIIACIICAWWLAQPASPKLTIYCAHDSIYAEGILERFRKETGIKFNVKYDTEATKSLGLVEMILQEKDAPICDVFWNNEVLGTIHLQSQQTLEPYKSPRHAKIPDQFKDPTGFWTGFGARLRVYITDPKRLAATQSAIDQRLEDEDLSEVTIAKPLYGTTRTQFTALWQIWGPEKVKAWYASLNERKINVVAGNAATRSMVGGGVCDLGFTDTDDFFVGRDRGQLVNMLPVRLPTEEVICIPNTISLIRGNDNPIEARKFIDFMLSAEIEVALANSKSRQIPLGPVDETTLPKEVREMLPLTKEAFDLTGLREHADACLAWLKEIYASN